MTKVSASERSEIQFWAIRYTYILTKKCPKWIGSQHQLIETIRGIWCNEAAYQAGVYIVFIDHSYRQIQTRIYLEYY